MKWTLAILVVFMAACVSAEAPTVDLGECYASGSGFNAVYVALEENATPENYTGVLEVTNECESGTTLEFLQPVDLVLGDVTEGEVVVTSRSVFVDSVARPDLDNPARITFRDVGFAVEPAVLKDGEPCPEEGCTNEVFDPQAQTYAVTVSGFSNYSLQGQQDFVVYSDMQPELRSKVYQSIDLGDLYRAEEFKCLVQIYATNEVGQFVLVQTNPQRKAQGVIVSPDPNLPESLGYFKTEGGIANVYFDGSTLAGYNDFEYVVQCASNSTKLVYEESISTRYVPVGRSLVGRGVWFTDGNNMFYLVIGTVLFVVGGLILWKAFRMVRRWS
jgi:hypothetical protein